MAEQGDAAVSIDELGGLRLWPVLDGTREPVAISAPAARQTAVAGTPDEVIVGVLDQAGSAHVLRFLRNGMTRGRAAIAGDVPITQIAALGDRLLVLRADQTIEEIDAGGRSVARLAADPGDRIAALAVRSGRVLVVLANDDGLASTVRWIEPGLAWGKRATLPAAIDPKSVALSPSHGLLAAAEAKSHQLFVYDLSVQPALATTTDIQLQPGEPVGFVDDHALAALSPVRWWTIGKQQQVDPWAATTPPNPPATTTIGAAGNGVVVSAQGPDLALVTPSRVRYLGWAEMNPSLVKLVGDRIAIATSGRHFAWLDRSLVETRTGDLPEGYSYGMPVDDQHVITDQGGPKGFEIKLVDFDHTDQPVTIGHFASVQRLQYEPHTQVVWFDDGSWLYRFHLDLAHDTVAELPKMQLSGETAFYALDPAAAGGAFAITSELDQTSTRLGELRERGGTLVREKGPTVPGFVSAVDARGGVWWRGADNGPIHHGDRTVPGGDVVPDHAGANALVSDGTTVALYDGDGVERWRAPAWRSYTFEFTADDRQIVMRGIGGIAVLDVATGERVAAACGWRFGIRDQATDVTAPGAESVCEDSGR